MSSKAISLGLSFIILISIASAAPEESTKSTSPVASFTADVTTGYVPLGVHFTSETTGNPTSYYWIFEPETSSDWNSHHSVTAVHTFKNPGVYTVSLVVTNSAGSSTVTETNYITVLAKPTQKPKAAFTADVTRGKVPLTVKFTDISTGGVPTSWYWDFRDGINSENTQTATHTFTSPGPYTITLTVTNDAGSDTVSKTEYITVSEASVTPEAPDASDASEKPTAGFTADVTTGYAPLGVHFTSKTIGNPTSYFWVFEPETSSDWNSHHSVTAVHTFKNPGVYTISLVVTNSAGSSTVTETNYITVLAKPTQTPSENPENTVTGRTEQPEIPENTVTGRTVQPEIPKNTVTGRTVQPETPENTVTREQAFRVGPTVSLRPLNSEINKSQDGIVELFLNNPSLNDRKLEVDMVISVPSDIYINAQDGGMSGGAGTVTGHFSVPPGSSRTITLHIKGEKVGTFPVHFSGNYWPGTNKDQWNPLNLDNSFEVKVPSDNPGPIPEPSIHGIPGLGVASLIFILVMVFILKRN
jgi:PKD repeat protein